VLEGQLRLVVDQPAGHHQVAGDPFGAVGLKRFDLVLGGAVKFLARDIVVDLGGPFPVRAVGAAEVAHVGYAGGAFFLPVAAESAGAGVAALSATGTAVKAARCAAFFLTVTAVGTVTPVAKRLAVLSSTETAAFTFTIAARTIAKRTVLPIAVRLPVTVTKGLAVTVTERLSLATTETTAVALALTPRTIPKRTVLPIAIRFTIAVTERLTVAVTERLALTATKASAVTFALTARTIPKRLLVAVAEGLALTATKASAVTFTIAARTIPKRLLVAVAEGLSLSPAGCTVGGIVVVPTGPGAESAGFPAGVVVSAEPAAVIPASVAAVVLSHVDSSCCEPTTGATAAARIRVSFSYATRNQALRSPYIFINSSGVASRGRTGQQPGDGIVAIFTLPRTLSHLMRVLEPRSLT
jgi:hypothetical protein